MTAAALEAGSALGDRFVLRQALGEGSMGFVWEAEELGSGKRVALKVLKSEKEEDRKRFLREMRAAAAIHHPNVIDVRDFMELPDGRLVMVMELLEGKTLGAVLARDGRISLGALARIMLPVLSALEAAHALGIVHRDLKPDNVFLADGGAKGAVVKVLDFGVVKFTAEDGAAARTQALTGTGALVGTPFYMSPEQVFADRELDTRADIWSLGIVIYECLAGIKPTQADTMGRVLKKIMAADFEPITAHCKDLPASVAVLVARMLSVNPDDRPRSAAEIRDVFERQTDDAMQAVASPPAPAMRCSRARPRFVVAAISMAALALAGGAAYAILRGAPSVVTSTGDPPSREAPPGAAAAPEVASSAPPGSAASPPVASMSAAPSAPAVAAHATRVPTPAAAPIIAKPTCEKHEVVSGGHCCPLGQEWRSARCERPLATTF